MKTTAFIFSVVLAALVGCSQSEPVTSTPPPAPPQPAAAPTALPPGHPPLDGATQQTMPPGHPPIDMSQQTLPPGTSADATNPKWEVPKDWQPGSASPVRRASYTVNGADIAVTVFPGDVGGMLANVNRWRGQMGLAPVAAEELDKLMSKIEVPGESAVLVDLANDSTAKRMVVVTIPHDGNSWFFKLTGNSDVVAAQKEAFVKFVQSVKY